jgi:two-component system, NarL family, response regulator
MVQRSIRRDDLLTRRQVEVLQFQANGMRPKEIANLLCVAEATVRMHIRDACNRLGVHGWFAAVVEARRRGLLHTQSN